MSKGRTLGMGELESAGERPAVFAPFGAGLLAAEAELGNLVVLTADLGKYTDVKPFRDVHASRFFNVGMAEQALVTVAAGLAKTGWTAMCTTYGCFATRRAYDFVAIACAHGAANVNIFAALPGLTTGYGGTHQAIEDLALMRSIPDIVVIDPCDATEMYQVTQALARTPGTSYCRLLRGNVPTVLDAATYRFRIGKAVPLRTGRDIGFISTGFMTERCLDAATRLAEHGSDCGVLHCPSIKPFDEAAVIEFARHHDRLVIAENHVATGALGSLAIEALYRAGLLRPTLHISIPDRFIECGSVPYLQDKYGLTTDRIVERVSGWDGVGARGTATVMQ